MNKEWKKSFAISVSEGCCETTATHGNEACCVIDVNIRKSADDQQSCCTSEQTSKNTSSCC